MSVIEEIKKLEKDGSNDKLIFMQKFKVALTFFVLFMLTLIVQSKYEITSEGLMLQQIPGISLGIFITLVGCAWSDYRKSKKDDKNEG